MKYKTPDEEERMTGVDLDKEEVQWVSCDCVTVWQAQCKKQLQAQ